MQVYDRWVQQGKFLINMDTGEIIKDKPKLPRHGLADPSDIIDCEQALRKWSLQRGVKQNSKDYFQGTTLDEFTESKTDKEKLELSIRMLKLLKEVKWLNKQFITREDLLEVLGKSSSNLRRHLDMLQRRGIIKYSIAKQNKNLYLIENNPLIRFIGDDQMRELYLENWYRDLIKHGESLTSEASIRRALDESNKVSPEEAYKFYEESINRSLVKTEQVCKDLRSALYCSQLEFTLMQREHKLKSLHTPPIVRSKD